MARGHPRIEVAGRAISQHVLVLAKVEALYVKAFFFWVVQTIAKTSEDCERGTEVIELPGLPYGVDET